MSDTLPPGRSRLVRGLTACARGTDPADAEALALILLHRCSGPAAPYRRALGLDPGTLSALVTAFFPTAAAGWQPGICFSHHVHRMARMEGRCCLTDGAAPADPASLEVIREEGDFLGLLLRHRSGHHPATPALAVILARACVENDHLWCSLGLTGREALAALLDRHFHPLVAANIHKRWWKRFFYECLSADGRPAHRTTICDACGHRPGCYADAPRVVPAPHGSTAQIPLGPLPNH